MSSTSASNGSDDRGGGDDGGARLDGGGQTGGGGLANLTDQQKKIIAVALVVHVIVATFTLRDLRRRPAAAVRGPTRLWRTWVTFNTTGSVAYWLFGRRRPPPDAL
jgi:hypothetical protein